MSYIGKEPTYVLPDGSVTTAKLGGDITTAGKAILDDANAASQLTTLGAVAAAGQTLPTGGYSATPYNGGTVSSGTFTLNEANGNFQYISNGGAFTLAPPTHNCTMILQITNSATAGAITTTGFTKVSGSTPTTTNGDDFIAYVTKINGFSFLSWTALQ